ncbi:MAG: PAS domain S-box protein [Myxococcota bacterium]
MDSRTVGNGVEMGEQDAQRRPSLPATPGVFLGADTPLELAALSAVADPVVITDSNGKIVFANPAFTAQNGFTLEEAKGNTPRILRGATPPEVVADLWRTISAGRTWQGVVQNRRKDGSEYTSELTIAPVIPEGQTTPSHFVATHRDITARLRAENEVRNGERRLRVLINALPEAVLVIQGGVVVDANTAAAAMAGVAELKDLLGGPVGAVIPEEDVKRLRETGTSTPSQDYRFLRRDGTEVVVEGAAVPVVVDAEPALLVVGRDVTEARQLRAKMVQLDRLVSVGTLAAGVAHEVNNPLAYLLSNLDFALERVAHELSLHSAATERTTEGGAQVAFLEELLASLRDARDGAERVRKISRDLKTFARGDGEGRRPVCVERVLDVAINMTRNQLVHRARLTRSQGEPAPVMANEGQLAQVFVNLLVNGAQAIRSGRPGENEIHVSTSMVGGNVVVMIRDTGAGIAPEALQRIFEPFFTTKPVGEGTGLGLSICFGIVRDLGGDITVKSDVGAGTEVTVTLPALRRGHDAEGAQQRKEPLRSQGNESAASPAPARR